MNAAASPSPHRHPPVRTEPRRPQPIVPTRRPPERRDPPAAGPRDISTVRPGRFAVALLAMALAGCATPAAPIVLAPVGPAPATATPAVETGTLVVYTPFDPHAHFTDVDPDRRHHTDYTLQAADGRWLRRGHNDTGTVLEGPVAVALPPGHYRVLAEANGWGEVVVPVVITARRETCLHLEGGGPAPRAGRSTPDGFVRLPDGQVVGWAAAPDAPPAARP